MANAETDNGRPNRMSRQKQKTRNALISAALSVMARKGAEAATINDITEAADVGFGSFYNHFASKEEILSVVTEELLDRIGSSVDQATQGISDHWELLSASIRLFMEIVISKPEWAQFIIRISATPSYRQFRIFQRLFRDIERVTKAPGSEIVDPGAINFVIGGALQFLVIALLEGDLPRKNAPNRIAAAVLRILGQPEDQIARLLAKKLPKVAGLAD